MAKSSYSDQEMRQVLNALYKEKKKANEIASKLQEKSDESSRLKTELQKSQEDSNVDRLQQLLATYKEKFENAKDDADSNTLEVGALKENLAEFAYLQEENKALLQQIVKLKERAGINSPIPNATQNQLEIFQLKEDVQQAQNQALRDKQKIEKLLQQVSDKERKLQDVVSIEEALKRASEKKKQLEESIVLLFARSGFYKIS